MITIVIKPYASRDDIDLAWGLTRHDPNAARWQAVEDARHARSRGWKTPAYDRLP